MTKKKAANSEKKAKSESKERVVTKAKTRTKTKATKSDAAKTEPDGGVPNETSAVAAPSAGTAEPPADAAPAAEAAAALVAVAEVVEVAAAQVATGATNDAAGAGETTAADGPALPPVGTVIKKLDRKGAVRCQCTVIEGGKIRYRGKVYTSLSGAAAAAASDLGLTSKSLNGWAWWGLAKPAAKTGARRGKDPVKAFEKAWAVFRERINKLIADELPDDARKQLAAAVRERADALAAVASSAFDGRAA